MPGGRMTLSSSDASPLKNCTTSLREDDPRVRIRSKPNYKPSRVVAVLLPCVGVVLRLRQSFAFRVFAVPQSFQEGAAPTATCPRAVALRKLRRGPRFLRPHELDDFAARDVKAQADDLIFVHDLAGWQIIIVAMLQAAR